MFSTLPRTLFGLGSLFGTHLVHANLFSLSLLLSLLLSFHLIPDQSLTIFRTRGAPASRLTLRRTIVLMAYVVDQRVLR